MLNSHMTPGKIVMKCIINEESPGDQVMTAGKVHQYRSEALTILTQLTYTFLSTVR